MRKDIYLVRHGQTDYNLEHKWQGSGIDAELNDKGIATAHEMAARLADKGIEQIYCSKLVRGTKTADIIAKKLGVSVEVKPEFIATYIGEITGWTKEQILQKYPNLPKKVIEKEEDLLVQFPGGELKLDVQKRMFKGLDDVAKSKHSKICVVAHSESTKYVLFKLSKSVNLSRNDMLFHLVYEDGNWRLEDEENLMKISEEK